MDRKHIVHARRNLNEPLSLPFESTIGTAAVLCFFLYFDGYSTNVNANAIQMTIVQYFFRFVRFLHRFALQTFHH